MSKMYQTLISADALAERLTQGAPTRLFDCRTTGRTRSRSSAARCATLKVPCTQIWTSISPTSQACREGTPYPPSILGWPKPVAGD